ncbi:hypothetical protein GCK72_015335 [Caenorhabditis remanei]|uniref:Uncharacterized protein n=1 Tax=Caenorhabditis remanei TaxID=31234 RepID=A0A6A5GWK7_CAERE|nr:hypothetical protein GCK72_015335 [Caenorhabditis remanei]KAF1758875.1 hypothetical protein GCK72_015335 [Caenorhabditis remanei]
MERKTTKTSSSPSMTSGEHDFRRAATTADSRRSQQEKMEGGGTTEARNDISTKPKDSGNKRRAEKTPAIPILMNSINP